MAGDARVLRDWLTTCAAFVAQQRRLFPEKDWVLIVIGRMHSSLYTQNYTESTLFCTRYTEWPKKTGSGTLYRLYTVHCTDCTHVYSTQYTLYTYCTITIPSLTDISSHDLVNLFYRYHIWSIFFINHVNILATLKRFAPPKLYFSQFTFKSFESLYYKYCCLFISFHNSCLTSIYSVWSLSNKVLIQLVNVVKKLWFESTTTPS